MSQLLTSLSIRKTCSIIANSTPHPALYIKVTNSSICPRVYYYHFSSSSAAQKLQTTQHANISRLYARRILDLAALSAAAMVYTTQMEGKISKPLEWSTIDLEEQRREFGQSISSLGKTKLSRAWAAGSRIFNLALLASPLVLLVPLGYITGPDTKPNDFAWNYAIWSAEKAGPTFIKLIQWATTRADIFPAEFIAKFSRLQDDTIGHSWKETEAQLKQAFGPNYHEILDFGSMASDNDGYNNKRHKYAPIGSGCIAQVYKGKLKKAAKHFPAGTEVAIKVTHPNILHKVCVDFYILNKITSLFEKIPYLNLDYLSMRDSVAQFRDIMIPQLDLRVEARNLQRFRRNFDGDEYIDFPTPISDYTSQNVLVETFIHGLPILEFMKEGNSTKKEREEMAIIGLESTMKMIFLHDFIHGDLHPGNIIVNKNNNVRGKPWRMNFIDCGLVVELGERDHVNLVKVLGALVKRDGLEAGKLMIDTSKKCQANELDMELFCKGIQRICDVDAEQNFLESVGDYLADICYLACKHKVKLEASFINAALACEIMEGIASKLHPNMQVQRIALPMVVKAELMHGIKSMKSVF